MKNRLILKVLDADAWRAAQEGSRVSAPVDIADGFVHFSTPDQVQDTLDKWFQGIENAVLIAFDANDFGDVLKWEISRGGDLFPHVYADVFVEIAKKYWLLKIGPSGAPLAPDEALNFRFK